MQMIMEVELPNEPFNTLVRQGTAGETLRASWLTSSRVHSGV
jgi:hypothetical protein